MSDDLVKRLRPLSWDDIDARIGVPIDETMREAADRIEELEAKLVKAVEALEKSAVMHHIRGHEEMADEICTALAALKGDKC